MTRDYRYWHWCWSLVTLAGLSGGWLGEPSKALAQAPAATAEPDVQAPATVVPAPREGEWWTNRHESFNHRVQQGNVDLLFIGDSITHDWEGRGKDVWDKHFAPRNAVNLGIGGDRTQHVLWRLEHGNLAGIHPKLAVLMIGTNNSNGDDHTAGEIADGIRAIVAKLRQEQPQMKVLLLAIFPRGPEPNAQREKNAEASRLASQAADGEMVNYLDIGDRFLAEGGKLPPEIMYDYLHLTPAGYALWAEAIEPHVARLMGETK